MITVMIVVNLIAILSSVILLALKGKTFDFSGKAIMVYIIIMCTILLTINCQQLIINAEYIDPTQESIIYKHYDIEEIKKLRLISDTETNQTEEQTEEEDMVYYDIPLDKSIQEFIINWCNANNFDEVLVFAVIRCESNYDIYCNYKDQDFGLMQININTFDDYNLDMETVYDPYLNCKIGMESLLRHYNAVNGDLHKTLIRYNCGATGARRLFNKGIFKTWYSKKVMSKYVEIEKLIIGE